MVYVFSYKQFVVNNKLCRHSLGTNVRLLRHLAAFLLPGNAAIPYIGTKNPTQNFTLQTKKIGRLKNGFDTESTARHLS